MRNLKRVLALALALVMMLGMMITASAASYTDEAAIDADYAEAVEVLTGMGVFQGTGAGFAPKAILTRAEAAALIYRVISADVKDSKIDLYDYSSFDDVATGKWYTGYVTYAANGGYIKGYDGNFMPDAQVTGIQVLTIMLRAMGYGQKGEFEGAAWKDNVLTTADDLGILDNVNVKSLDVPATRELVAQLLWDAVKAPTTTYTPAFGYYPTTGVSLGVKNFYLKSAASSDEWGRPGVIWFADKNADGAKAVKEALYAIIEEAPLATYTTAVTECQIASDIGLKDIETYVMYTNGKVNASSYAVQPLDTVQRIGGQGTLVEVYEDEIVVINTFLAEVLDVTPARYDAAGHKAADAMIKLHVYDSYTTAQSNTVNLVLTDDEANFTYAKGDMVLVNSYTNNTPLASGAVTVNAVATTGTTLPMANYAEILGLATAQVGAQTFHWYNAAKHTIDGVNYDDAAWYKLDEAQKNTAKYTWYFDQYGNVIGSTDIATIYAYGIIEQIQWINPVGAAGYAQATIRYVDGTTAEAVIASVNGANLRYAQDTTSYEQQVDFPYVSTNISNNFELLGTDLYRIGTNPNGTLALTHVYTEGDTPANGRDADESEDNHIENAKINPYGAGATALSAISNGTDVVYANANTVFLVRTNVVRAGQVVGYTYEVVTGYQNMAKYNVATVDWVKTNNDSYVDLVYVTGTPATAEPYYALFFLTSKAGIQAVLNAQGNSVDYYVVSGMLDGVAGSYKIDAAADYDSYTDWQAGVVNPITMANIEGMLNKMYVVEVTGDEITWVKDTEVLDDAELKNTIPEVKYNGTAMDYYAAATTPGTKDIVTKNGEVLYVDGKYYTVNGMETPTFGTWADDMSMKTVYVIYDTTKYVTVDGGKVAYVAKAVYVIDTPDVIDPSGNIPTLGTIVRTLNIVNKDTGSVIASYTDTVTVAGGTSITYTTAGMASVLGVGATNLVPFGAGSVTVAPAAGTIVNATLNAYYAN